LFTNLKYLVVIFIIFPFTCLSNGLFQDSQLQIEKNIKLKNTKDIKENFYNNLKTNKNYILNFWATWCIPCKKELPDLMKLQKENKEFKIIIISIDKKPIKEQLEYLKKYKVNKLTSYFDSEMALFKSFQLRGVPTTLLVKQKFVIAKKEGIFKYNTKSLNNIINFFN